MSYYDDKIVSKDEIVERTLVSVAKPIVQGASSTILGVIGMIYAPSYAFVIFFKMILIVIGLSVTHSLVLVPLFLKFVLDLQNYFKQQRWCDKNIVSNNRESHAYVNNAIDIDNIDTVTHM